MEPAPTLGVLVVHDDPATLYWLLRILRDAGYRVVADTNLTEALIRVRDDPTIGLLVADWYLGEENAAGLVLAVRERDPDFPVLVVTAHLAGLSRIRHRLPPDVLTILTPVEPEALLDAVTALWGDVPQPAIPPREFPPAPETVTTSVILVVDDEDAIRHLTMRVLAGAGYAVLEARNGEEALTVLRNLVAPVQLVVSDVRMPVMGGRRLGEHVEREYPGVPVLYVSGYGSEPSPGGTPLAPLLTKPFTRDELLAEVQRLLHSRRDRAGSAR